jgi:hypothetical protein
MKNRLFILLFIATIFVFHPSFVVLLHEKIIAILGLTSWIDELIKTAKKWMNRTKKRPIQDEMSQTVSVTRKERIKQARKQRFLTFAMRVLLVLVIIAVMTM